MLNIIITNSEAICASPAEGNALHFDPTRLTPEQIEQFKALLGIGSNSEQQPSTPVAFDPATLTEEQVVSLRERVFDIFSSGDEFTSRNVQVYAKLIEVPSGAGTYENSARNFVENALYLGAEDFADIMFARTFLPIGEGTEFDKQQAVDDLAQKHSVILDKMGGNRYNLSSILYLALTGLIKNDEQIKELNAKVTTLETRLSMINLVDVLEAFVTTDRGRNEFNTMMSNFTHDEKGAEIDWSRWQGFLRNAGEPIDTEASRILGMSALAFMMSKANL